MAAVGNVLIIGGGISGLTLAIALRRQGICSVDVIERRTDITSQAGIGMSLQANALRALASIGIADACAEAGFGSDGILLRQADGTLIASMPSEKLWGPDKPAQVGIARKRLHEVLIDGSEQSGVQLRLGVTDGTWIEDAAGVDVSFSDGSRATYDLVVGADGLNSRVRERLYPGFKYQFSGQVVWRGWAERPTPDTMMEQHMGGKVGAVGICPINAREAYIYIVDVLDGEPPRLDDPTLADQFRALLDGYGGKIALMRPTFTDPRKIDVRAMPWHVLPAPWHRGRVAVIGDAAHSLPPVLAQGAALGIEDAIVLADELGRDQDLESALRQFVSRRHARVSTTVANAVRLADAEVRHLPDIDVPGVMRATRTMLAQPL
jgi:2-polyprenyl-6-methoxyphenol hydroxylase-like FAD-dependent oxidoreductase